MLTVLMPVKNSQYITHSLLALTQQLNSELIHEIVSKIIILDSSDVPITTDPLVSEIFGIFDSAAIEIEYSFNRYIDLPTARKLLLNKVYTEYGMFLDADVVIQSGLNHASLKLLDNYAFVAPQVISPLNMNGYENYIRDLVSVEEIPPEIRRRPWLLQFVPCRDNLPLNTAGTFGLLFRTCLAKEVSKIFGWGSLLPREDMLLSRLLTIEMGEQKGLDQSVFGTTYPGYRAYHFGATRKDVWNARTNAALEKAFDVTETYTELQKLVSILNEGKTRD